MSRRLLRRLLHSAFTKLLVIILAAGAAITLTVVVGFSVIRFHSLSLLDRNLILYAEYLTRDLGDPPDFKRAEEIARRTGLAIRFDHPKRSWRTAEFPASLPLERARIRRHDAGILTGNLRGYTFIRLRHGEGDLIFLTPRIAKDHENAGWILLGMAAALSAILAAAHYFIRSVLKPLRSLKTGVEALGAGRLDHRVSETGHDEFRDLAVAFNTMAKRLSDLLKNKERLLLDVSHELRSPLTRLKIQLEFMRDEEIRQSMQADVAEMEAMVSTILEEARLRSSTAALKREKIEMADLIRSIVADFTDHPPDVVFTPSEQAYIQADREKMRMLLRNLLDNAVQNTPEGGEPVEISMARREEQVEIIVKDRGAGIPEADLPHVFEPFYRADTSRSRKTGGYGLGLSLCKAIVEAHSGSIDITSAPGRGTRVKAMLPIS